MDEQMTEQPKPKPKFYLLKDFPQDLKEQAQHRAIEEKVSFKEILIRAVKQYLERKEENV